MPQNTGHYSRPLTMPQNKREGLANAVQIIINVLEAGDAHEALMQAVNLLDDVRSNSNPYELGVYKPRKKKENNYRGNVNVD
jgi:hypothetical protein